MFTLVFTDKKQQKYAGTAARFQQYCTQPRIGPVISRGEAPLEASNFKLMYFFSVFSYIDVSSMLIYFIVIR